MLTVVGALASFSDITLTKVLVESVCRGHKASVLHAYWQAKEALAEAGISIVRNLFHCLHIKLVLYDCLSQMEGNMDFERQFLKGHIFADEALKDFLRTFVSTSNNKMGATFAFLGRFISITKVCAKHDLSYFVSKRFLNIYTFVFIEQSKRLCH